MLVYHIAQLSSYTNRNLAQHVLKSIWSSWASAKGQESFPVPPNSSPLLRRLTMPFSYKNSEISPELQMDPLSGPEKSNSDAERE